MLRFELLLAKKEKYKNVHCFQEDVIDSYKKMSYVVTQIVNNMYNELRS